MELGLRRPVQAGGDCDNDWGNDWGNGWGNARTAHGSRSGCCPFTKDTSRTTNPLILAGHRAFAGLPGALCLILLWRAGGVVAHARVIPRTAETISEKTQVDGPLDGVCT